MHGAEVKSTLNFYSVESRTDILYYKVNIVYVNFKVCASNIVLQERSGVIKIIRFLPLAV